MTQPAAPSTAATAAPKPLHIFKPGRWTTMAGEVIEFSEADLRASAAAFSPALSKAPIVIGHPATDDPAQGWVAALHATERGLFATPTQVDPAFAQAARAGRYGTVSAKFYRPTDAGNPVPGVWYLRHVGMLGAQSPALKGLDSPAFAGPGDSEGGVCFAQGVAFGEWEETPQPEPAPVLAQASPDSIIPTPEASVTPEEKAALVARNNELEAQMAAMQADNAKAQAAQRHAANLAFCEDLGAQARLAPAVRPLAVALLDHLAEQSAPVQFGEGEAQAPLLDAFKAFLAALPKQVQFGETATSERAAGAASAPVAFAAPQGYSVEPMSMALHAKALAHQQAHPGMSYVQAVQAVA